MKLSDYVIQFITELGVKHVFLISGGAVVHLVDSVSKNPNIKYICNNHEQACAMAADGYSRVSGNIGVAMSTSGPGATNLLTGVAGAYYDSIPLLCITGQVTTFRLKGDSGVRQVGFQETSTVDIYKSITKYATMVKNANDIKYELQKAVWIAKSGRCGPVLVDIPDDLQRTDIDVNSLGEFSCSGTYKSVDDRSIPLCIELLSKALRPVVILGGGIRLSKAEEEAKEFIERLGFPVIPTWAVAGIVPFNHPLNAGFFGQHGMKYGNLAIQNSDLLLVLGSRLDTHMTGSIIGNFAPNAKKILVDIDENEIMRTPHDVGINMDIKDFIKLMSSKKFDVNNVYDWHKQISFWRLQYPICLPEYCDCDDVNPYLFFNYMSSHVPEDSIVLTDTGSALAWFMQAFEFRKQKVFSDWNNTAMGWCLPASIGAHFAGGEKIVAIMGDGSLQMNIQELSTIRLHSLPIKIFVINNHGYSMIRQTQDDWLKSKYEASTDRTIGCPDFVKVANAYDIRSVNIDKRCDIDNKLREVMAGDDPVLCNVDISDIHRIKPVVKYGEKLDG